MQRCGADTPFTIFKRWGSRRNRELDLFDRGDAKLIDVESVDLQVSFGKGDKVCPTSSLLAPAGCGFTTTSILCASCVLPADGVVFLLV